MFLKGGGVFVSRVSLSFSGKKLALPLLQAEMERKKKKGEMQKNGKREKNRKVGRKKKRRNNSFSVFSQKDTSIQ